jgi:putative nucleotidyltransferase with HDIG domain
MGDAFNIDYLLEEVVTLPSLPDTVMRVTSMADDPDCPLSDVASAISADPSLSLKTLRLVNSAYYGLGQRIGTVEHAVVLLGIKVIKNLALTATVFETLQVSTSSFLRHSITCGVAMRAFAETGKTGLSPTVEGDEAFVFGLLHDVGKVILEEYCKKQWADVAPEVKERRIPWHVAEREIIGVDHAEMGARLAEKWRLSPRLVDAIGGHHDLDRCASAENRPFAACVSVADHLCAASGAPAYRDPVYDFPDAMYETAGIGHANLPAVAEHFFRNYHIVDELLTLAT